MNKRAPQTQSGERQRGSGVKGDRNGRSVLSRHGLIVAARIRFGQTRQRRRAKFRTVSIEVRKSTMVRPC